MIWRGSSSVRLAAMAPKIEEDDSDDELPLASRVKKETSTPKGERRFTPAPGRRADRGVFLFTFFTEREWEFQTRRRRTRNSQQAHKVKPFEAGFDSRPNLV